MKKSTETTKNNIKVHKEMLTISEIREYYFTMSYRKCKLFLLSYIPYVKIGNTYYFSKAKIEKIAATDQDKEYELENY